jgi:hypothetical protein
MTTMVESLVDSALSIGGREFRSRLLVGTGKYRDNSSMVEAITASGAEIVTVAVRRIDLDRTKEEGILYHLDPKRFFLLANTAGCYTAEDAVRYARLAREAGFNEFIKLEVIGDEETLLPDVAGLLEAARTLVAEGFKVMAYTNDDLITAIKLEDAGDQAAPLSTGDRRCRCRDSFRCLHHDGAGRRRDTHEHGPRRRRESGCHGPGDEVGRRGGALGILSGSNGSTRDRSAVQSHDGHAWVVWFTALARARPRWMSCVESEQVRCSEPLTAQPYAVFQTPTGA